MMDSDVGADGEPLRKFLTATVRHPRHLRREAFDVLRLAIEHGFGDEQGKVGVLDARLLEAVVQLALHILPEAVAVGLEDTAARDGRVVHHPGAFDDIYVPLVKLIVVHIARLFNKVRRRDHGGYSLS